MFQQFFGLSPSAPAHASSPDSNGQPIAHVFVDCAQSTNPFLYAKECVTREMEARGIPKFITFLTYIVSRGAETIDFVEALKIVEIIASFTFSHRIEVHKEPLAESSYALMCELGKCFAHAKPADVVFIATTDDIVFKTFSIKEKMAIDIVRIMSPTHVALLRGVSEREEEEEMQEEEGNAKE